MNMQMRARLKAVRLDRNAFQISVIYLLIGGLWILFSDRFAEAISKNVQTLTTVSTYKGWGYVLITGLILYWLIHSNNSRLQKENEELQAAEKNYKDIFDHATVGIYRSTPDGRLLTVNSALAAMFGYTSPDEMLASINDIGSQVYKISARRAEYQNTITEQGFIKEFVNEERRKDGSWIWTSTNAHSIQDDAGNILYYEGFTIDVTERNQAEEKLLASEIQYRRLFEAAKDGILILNADTGEIVDVNPFLEEMLGYSQAEFLGKQLWEIGLFKDIVANKAAFLKLQEEGYVRYELGGVREQCL
jgi:PAS domain S-box-containing protein